MRLPNKPTTSNPRSHRTWRLGTVLYNWMPRRHKYIRTDIDEVDGKAALSFIDKFHRLGLFSDLERQCGDAQDIYTYYCQWHYSLVDDIEVYFKLFRILQRYIGDGSWLDDLHEKAINETPYGGETHYYVPEYIKSLLELASAIDHFKEEALYETGWVLKLERGIKAINDDRIQFYNAGIVLELDVSSAIENYGEHRKAVYESLLEAVRYYERLTEEYPIEKEIGGY